MKNLLFAIIAVTLMFSSNAEAKFATEGSTVLGSGISFSNTTNKDKDGEKTGSKMALELMPGASYFIMDNLALGGAIVFNMGSTCNDKDCKNENSNSAMGIALVPAYYHEASDDLFIFGKLNIKYLMGSSKTKANDKETDGPETTHLGFGLDAGVALPFGADKGGLLEIGLGYNMMNKTSKPKQGDEVKSSSADLSLNTTFAVFF